MRLYRCVAPKAVCGMVVEDGRAVNCAPYIRELVLGLREETALKALNSFEVSLIVDARAASPERGTEG